MGLVYLLSVREFLSVVSDAVGRAEPWLLPAIHTYTLCLGAGGCIGFSPMEAFGFGFDLTSDSLLPFPGFPISGSYIWSWALSNVVNYFEVQITRGVMGKCVLAHNLKRSTPVILPMDSLFHF